MSQLLCWSPCRGVPALCWSPCRGVTALCWSPCRGHGVARLSLFNDSNVTFGFPLRRRRARYHYRSKHYTASIMELDDPAHPELLMNKTEDVGAAAGSGGPTFTLYLYDHDVKQAR